MKDLIKNISKLCSKHLRDLSHQQGLKLKSTDAHELVASIIGYNSRAAMLADTHYPLSNLPKARLIVLTNPEFINKRRATLMGLPIDLPSSSFLVESIYEFLSKEEVITTQNIWTMDELKSESVLLAIDYVYRNGLNDLYKNSKEDDITVELKTDGILVTITPYHDTTKSSELRKKTAQRISSSIIITVWFQRIAGHIGFAEPEINTRSIPMLFRKQA